MDIKTYQALQSSVSTLYPKYQEDEATRARAMGLIEIERKLGDVCAIQRIIICEDSEFKNDLVSLLNKAVESRRALVPDFKSDK